MNNYTINEFKNSQVAKQSINFGKIPTFITLAALVALTIAAALSF